jgi:hypothetical protein
MGMNNICKAEMTGNSSTASVGTKLLYATVSVRSPQLRFELILGNGCNAEFSLLGNALAQGFSTRRLARQP